MQDTVFRVVGYIAKVWQTMYIEKTARQMTLQTTRAFTRVVKYTAKRPSNDLEGRMRSDHLSRAEKQAIRSAYCR
ncbi:predicted protein [Plenodomus lingam JN3]|uniref:Predicted protein n=1 Tax=Leptosphaeria maculans (strain JN3 / isolate v23.1.3 / race Av1-4-5-6-7-8) TaxID=985895 RepID=E5R567_LEPMJ|nr:predicted protein [Plenodomus lingam JN3]CBX92037.1 predicted protein [Plenodomus lingam JN3]